MQILVDHDHRVPARCRSHARDDLIAGNHSRRRRKRHQTMGIQRMPGLIRVGGPERRLELPEVITHQRIGAEVCLILHDSPDRLEFRSMAQVRSSPTPNTSIECDLKRTSQSPYAKREVDCQEGTNMAETRTNETESANVRQASRSGNGGRTQQDPNQPTNQQAQGGSLMRQGSETGTGRGLTRSGSRQLSQSSQHPFSMMRRVSRDMDRLFDSFFGTGFGSSLWGGGGRAARMLRRCGRPRSMSSAVTTPWC